MLGRYQVLKPLAKGGMAEVILARTIGLGGFARHVVIKRIRVEHGSDQKSIDMFLDEARLVASLHHRNIVQVHDVGEEDAKYFFVMEYVHGRDTRELLRLIKDKKEQIPLEHVITIVSAAAAGLHYAHEQRGPDRKPLNIVHRDISPGNILLAFDGAVKVVDFGIAKAEARSAETQAGETKGKLGYMSPEQCRAQPIDRRTDIFLLGIVLYELCTVRRLFKADSRYETMALIAEAEIPSPSKFRKDLPPDLEQIIVKALGKTPEERFQTADELRLALEASAARANLPVSQSRLADYLKEQFGDVPEPWLEGEEVPPPPPEVIERIRSSSQLIAVRPSQPMPVVETSKPEPVAPQVTAAAVDAEPVVPDPVAPEAVAPEPVVPEAVVPEAVVAEPAKPVIGTSTTPSEPVKPVDTKSTQPELEAIKAAKPVVAGEPAGPDPDDAAPVPVVARKSAPVSGPVYPVYPTAPSNKRALGFIVLFVLVAGLIGGAFIFLRSDLEQTKAASPAVPADADAPALADAALLTETVAVDAAVEVVTPDAAPAEATAPIDAGVSAAAVAAPVEPTAKKLPPARPKPRPRPAVKPKPKAKPAAVEPAADQPATDPPADKPVEPPPEPAPEPSLP